MNVNIQTHDRKCSLRYMFATVVIVVIQTSRQLQKQTIIQATEEVVHFALSKNPQH